MNVLIPFLTINLIYKFKTETE